MMNKNQYLITLYETELKEIFGNKFELIKKYPNIISFPTDKHIEPKLCECCGQPIPISKHWFTWEDGFRPTPDQIKIDLNLVASVLKDMYTYPDFKNDWNFYMKSK